MSLEYLVSHIRMDELLAEAATQRQAAIARRSRRRRKPGRPRAVRRFARRVARAPHDLPTEVPA